jgi:murein DD-endopeptidase MepM/ murein hydrolase activator NlpD
MELTWPLSDHIITRNFAYMSSIYVGGQHAAVDLVRARGATRVSSILAIAAGTVAGVGWDMYSGFFVSIDHDKGWRSFYRHMYGQSPVVVGQRVIQGQFIGKVGNTGWSVGDHLHFDLWNKTVYDSTAFWKNGWWAHDPELYLGKGDEMTSAEREEIQAMITASLRSWIGPRDEISAETNRKLFVHIRDRAAHSGSGSGGLQSGDTVKIIKQ